MRATTYTFTIRDRERTTCTPLCDSVYNFKLTLLMSEEIKGDNNAEEQPAAQPEQVQEPAVNEQVTTDQATGNTVKRTGKLSKRD